MKFAELRARVYRELPRPEYRVNWYEEGKSSDSAYTVVPLDDGLFTLFHPTGRGGYTQVQDDAGAAVMFANEDDACDYVWAQLWAEETGPKPEVVHLSPEEVAMRVERQRQRRHDPESA